MLLLLPLPSSSSRFPCSLLSCCVPPASSFSSLPPPIAPTLSVSSQILSSLTPLSSPLLVTLPSSTFPSAMSLPSPIPSVLPSLLLSPQRVGPRALIVTSSASLLVRPHSGSRLSRDTRDLTVPSSPAPPGESSLCARTIIGYRRTSGGLRATCGSSLTRVHRPGEIMVQLVTKGGESGCPLTRSMMEGPPTLLIGRPDPVSRRKFLASPSAPPCLHHLPPCPPPSLPPPPVLRQASLPHPNHPPNTPHTPPPFAARRRPTPARKSRHNDKEIEGTL